MTAPRLRREAHRELAAALAPLGFRWTGFDGRDHLVFRHDDGRVLHLPATPRSPYMNRKIAIVRARRPPGVPLARGQSKTDTPHRGTS